MLSGLSYILVGCPWVERPLLTKLFLVGRRVHNWRKSVPQQGRLLHSLLLLKFIMEYRRSIRTLDNTCFRLESIVLPVFLHWEQVQCDNIWETELFLHLSLTLVEIGRVSRPCIHYISDLKLRLFSDILTGRRN